MRQQKPEVTQDVTTQLTNPVGSEDAELVVTELEVLLP
jgi:hypothetical protein